MNMLSQTLLKELEMEMPGTRKTLERIPEAMTWTPHPKSMTLGRLAQHLSEIPDWAVKAISLDELDLAPPGSAPHQPPPLPASRSQVLENFDKNVAAAKAALANTSDEHMIKPWSLKMGGKTILTMPRAAVVRNFVLNHNIHHRAQLGVYLRLNDIPVPSIYGPSADEGSMG
jgi:uncharacterized damage-inducible protein DinB